MRARSRSTGARDALRATRTRTATGSLLDVAIDAAIGLLALGASVYVVYLLEIVKLANPFIRRRAERARVARKRAQDRLATPETKSARLRSGSGACAVTNSPPRGSAMLRADGAARSPARFPLPRRARCWRS